MIAAALGAAALLVAAGMAGDARAEPLRLAYATWVGYGPFFVAQKKGYFKEEGVTVELVKIEDVNVRFTALAAGRIDALASTVDTLPLYLKQGGLRYQYIFAIDDSRGGDGVVANKEIEGIAGLKGKKVGFAVGSTSQFYINVLLEEAGLSQSDIEVVDMSAGDAGRAFITAQVDAAVTWEPWLTRGRQTMHGQLMADSSEKPGLITGVVLAPADVIASRNTELRALYRGWLRAVEFFKTNPQEALSIMAKGIGGSLKNPSVFIQALRGAAYYDAAMNAAYFGTPDDPGGLRDTVKRALDIWSGFDRLVLSVTPGSLINHSVVEQPAEPEPAQSEISQ